MKSRWVLTSVQKLGLFLTRFRRLPTVYWAILASIFGIADFLTWSILADIPSSQRWRLTLGIAVGAFIFTLIVVIVRPSETETTIYARSLTRMAREAFNKNDYAEALRLLEASLRLDKDNVSTWSLLGRTLVRTGKFKESLLPLSRGLDLSQVEGNKHILLLNRSLAHYFLGNLGQSLDDLNQILGDTPTHIEALRLRATVWLRLNRLDNALNDVDTALKKRPTYLCAHAIKAVILKHQGKTRAAKEELKQCDSIQPDDSVDFYCLSLAHAHLGRIEDSLKYLQTSIQHDTKCLHRATRDPLFDLMKENPQFIAITSEHGIAANSNTNS
jgi:tetratricopeptide (TPR) repeat protein